MVESNICMKLNIRDRIFSREMKSFCKTINREMSLHCVTRILIWNSIDENIQIFLMFEIVWMDQISHRMRQCTCAYNHSERIHFSISLQWQKKMLIPFSEKSTEQIFFQKAWFNEVVRWGNHQWENNIILLKNGEYHTFF